MVQLLKNFSRLQRFCFRMLCVSANHAGLYVTHEQLNAKGIESRPHG